MRFYFHQYLNGKLTRNHEGRDFENEQSARVYAFSEAASLLSGAMDGTNNAYVAVEVTNHGKTNFVVRGNISLEEKYAASVGSLFHFRIDAIPLNPHMAGEIGPAMLLHACKLGLEGIVSKHRDRARPQKITLRETRASRAADLLPRPSLQPFGSACRRRLRSMDRRCSPHRASVRSTDFFDQAQDSPRKT